MFLQTSPEIYRLSGGREVSKIELESLDAAISRDVMADKPAGIVERINLKPSTAAKLALVTYDPVSHAQ